jgi:hypothetical protein
LEAIAKLHTIIDNRLVSIERSLARFDNETKAAFLNFYTKIDASVAPKDEKPSVNNGVESTMPGVANA